MSVWTFFDEITKVPRPSKREEKIIAYLENFAVRFNLPIKKDAVGNILITKKATAGMEQRPTIVLQSHMDMVCEKNADVTHDFDNDPIVTRVDGEWMCAKGTTLGADNGIGMAYALAILADNSLKHGQVEALFTIDEETGLTGANALQPGFFTGKTLLNLDSEDLGEVFIGCAGGIDTVATFEVAYEPVAADSFFFQLKVKGLRGGHSGCDVHLGLANANKLLVRFLLRLKRLMPVSVGYIEGGNLRNAIPREAMCTALVPSANKEQVRIELNHFLAELEQEFAAVEPSLAIELESMEAFTSVIASTDLERLLLALHACPHGVMAMSHDIEGLVETSTNLASIKMSTLEHIVVTTSQRSSIESEKRDVALMVENVFVLAGATVTHGDGYPGWKPNASSAVLKAAQEVYARMFGAPMAVKAIHAGLECGLFSEKYPGLDMISVGPTMRGVHSPDERVHIPSVDAVYSFLVELLQYYKG